MSSAKEINSDDLPVTKELPIKPILIGCSIFVVFISGIYFYNFFDPLSNSHEIWGTFGDYIGGILNPLFGFASFTALLITLNLQREELAATNIQLARSAVAQDRSQRALNEQLETQSKQQFENTFFALLDQHNKILESHKGNLDTAHSSIMNMNGVLLNNLKTANISIKQLNATYGQYFRVLYQLLKLIATNIPNSNIGPDFSAEEIKNSPFAPNEKMYSNIVRSFLGYNTTQLLAINCYCDTEEHSYIKFKLLIERYAFLEHMPLNYRGSRENVTLFKEALAHYDAKAFDQSQFI